VSPTAIDDPEYCRKRAQEMRELAAEIGFADAKSQLLEMAQSYDRLAERADRQLRGS